MLFIPNGSPNGCTLTNPFQSPTATEATQRNWGVLPAALSVLAGLYFLRHYSWIYLGGYDLLPGQLSPPYSAMLSDLLYTAWVHSALVITFLNLVAAERWFRMRWIAACLLNLVSCVISPALFYASIAIQ